MIARLPVEDIIVFDVNEIDCVIESYFDTEAIVTKFIMM